MKVRHALLVVLCLTLAPLSATVSHGAATGIQYVTVDDGTEIAVQVFTPSNYVEGQTYPALVQIEGYGGAASPNDGTFVNRPDYVVVGISIRGTGCSQGELDLFSQRSAADGAWIIDNWIPNQPWSNGDVGIYGHSYGGLMGFLVAAQNPMHLRATAVSGLIDDFYRGILYPGGVSNYGFPILWGAGVRPALEHQGNASPLLADQHCRENYATHLGSDAAPRPQVFLDTYGSRFATEDSWAIRSALLTHIDGIQAPIQLGQQYQDEQTGPRGAHVLWENIPTATPKRITISTGRHNPNDPTGNKRDWFDCWMLRDGDGDRVTTTTSGKSCADVTDPDQRVLLYFESMGSDRLAPYVSSDWPLPETEWTRVFLNGDGTLSSERTDGDVTYLSTGNGRHMTADIGAVVPTGAPLGPIGFTTGLPDTARYEMPLEEDTALAGPLELSLYASITSVDTDFWAEILDVAPNGDTTFVQRGVLRASVNGGFDASRAARTPGGDIYRPYYEHLEITPVIPGEINRYEVEIFPLGHVWRAGHTLVLQLHAPPANDPISTYAFEPTTPSVVTIVQDADHPTSLLLPVMPTLPPFRAQTPACGSVVGEVCVTPALG